MRVGLAVLVMPVFAPMLGLAQLQRVKHFAISVADSINLELGAGCMDARKAPPEMNLFEHLHNICLY